MDFSAYSIVRAPAPMPSKMRNVQRRAPRRCIAYRWSGELRRCPEEQSLQALDEHLRRYKEKPVESFRAFREAMLVGRLPTLLRRFLLWLSLHALPRRRARHFGTFGVTTMSPFGARTLEVPTLWSAFLHYGPMTPSGEVAVGLAFDHRVMDGAVVGYTLLEMEQALHHNIISELQTMRSARAA